MGESSLENDKNKNTVKILCILCYLSILWIVAVIANRDNEKIKFHANQGIILSIFSFACYIVLRVLSVLLFMIAHMFMMITSLLWVVFYFLLAMYIVVGIYNVCADKQTPLPFIGELFVVLK